MSSVISRLRSRDSVSRTPNQFLHNGQPYPLSAFPESSLPGSPVEVSSVNFASSVSTIHDRSSIVSSAVMARSLQMSQLVFRFRPDGDPSRLFSSPALEPFNNPGRDITRAGLLSRVEPDIAYHGNFYARRMEDGTMRRLRPDWMQLLIGSNERPDDARVAADAELIGYIYKPGGQHSKHRGQMLTLAEVAHWAPEPHPLANFIGEAWVTAVCREVAADMQATDHVNKFFANAATANMVVKPPEMVNTPELFGEWVDAFEAGHRGAVNAWRNIYVAAGSDVQVVGSDLNSLSMEPMQGGFETRVAARSRVPTTVALFREGNKGSALNGGNYGQIRRMWADSWFSPYASAFCASMARIIEVPSNTEMTFDPARVLLLQEDQMDGANIEQVKASTIRALVDGGFDPASVVEAVQSQNMDRLEHTGKLSVQLMADGIEDGDAVATRALAEMIQKVYLGVGPVLTSDEARALLNKAGANLTGSLPTR